MRKLLAALALAIAVPAPAAPFLVQLGGERVVLDAPPGFADTGFLASPRLQEIAESLTPATDRILLFAISDADLRRFMGGDPPEMRRYMIAATPRALERERVTERQFEVLVSDSLRSLGAAPRPPDAKKYLDAQPHGRASLLTELRQGPGLLSLLHGARLPSQSSGWSEKPPQYVLTTSTLLLLRGKALHVALYTAFDVPADMDWLTSTTQRWAEELIRLNQR